MGLNENFIKRKISFYKYWLKEQVREDSYMPADPIERVKEEQLIVEYFDKDMFRRSKFHNK